MYIQNSDSNDAYYGTKIFFLECNMIFYEGLQHLKHERLPFLKAINFVLCPLYWFKNVLEQNIEKTTLRFLMLLCTLSIIV